MHSLERNKKVETGIFESAYHLKSEIGTPCDLTTVSRGPTKLGYPFGNGRTL